MNRTTIIIGVLILVLVLVTYLLAFSPDLDGTELDLTDDTEQDPIDDDDEEKSVIIQEQFIQCLKENNVVIFGSVTCPYCAQLVNSLGGYEVVAPIYVDCSQYPNRCKDEMQTRGVPEIQIDGVLYQESRLPANIGTEAGCVLNN